MRLDHEYASQLPDFVAPATMEDFPDLQIALFNHGLGQELGIRETDLLDMLRAPAHAQAYSGHQFGQFVSLLGDGRAMLLGEVTIGDLTFDLHAKGIGRTAFSRGGDGQAALGPMLREYLMAEALHARGIPTNRALAVVTTGKRIQRKRVVPGAILVRVARSHVRVGTMEFAALLAQNTKSTDVPDPRLRLIAHTAQRLGLPGTGNDLPLRLYQQVITSQAELLAHWMSAGFIHGVMNTDNTFLSGEGLDYGPCAFLDRLDPDACFSSIDAKGRYRFGNQPSIMLWNLARLGEAMQPHLPHADAVTALQGFSEQFRTSWLQRMQHILGLDHVERSSDSDMVATLIDTLIVTLGEEPIDYHGFLRALVDSFPAIPAEVYGQEISPALLAWVEQWLSMQPDPAILRKTIPVYVPRNELLQQAVTEAEDGEYNHFRTMLDLLLQPYERSHDPAHAVYEQPPAPDAPPFISYCGT